MRMGSGSELVLQRVAVSFETPVCFTQNLFNPANPVLANVLKPTGKRAVKLLVALELGIDALRPELSQQVAEYARQHDIELVEVLILEGGEAVKHSFAGVQQILEAISIATPTFWRSAGVHSSTRLGLPRRPRIAECAPSACRPPYSPRMTPASA
jgi:hypothetical protein